MADLKPPTRPQVQHGATSPDLVGFLQVDVPTIDNVASTDTTSANGQNEPGNDENSPTSAQKLLSELSSRQNDNYRFVTFELPPRDDLSNDTQFEQRVSFDTINIQAAEDPALGFLDDEQKAEYLSQRRRMSGETDSNRGRGQDRDFLSLRSPGTSPNGSPTRMRSPLRSRDVSALFARAQVLQYPTVPITTRRCCALSRMHRDFDALYSGKLADKGLWPMLRGRVIMIYVSGRKHTWVALDWILCNFVQHGDTVVVVASIQHSLGSSGSGLTRYPHPSNYPPRTERVRQRQRARPEYIKEIAANIMDYCLSVTNPNAIIKITLELAEGQTKDVLKDMYKLYEPNIVSTGSKSNTKNSAPLKSWHSSRLSDRLVKLFPLPVIVVPAANMGPFEQKLSTSISYKSSSESSQPQSDAQMSSSLRSSVREISHDGQNDSDPDSDADSLSDSSFQSHSSSGSESSSGSYSSFDEIAELYNEYKSGVKSKLEHFEKRDVDENYFANFIKTISDSSSRFCEELKGIDPDFRGNGAKLAREITGSNSFGAVPYKTKSLLPPIEKGSTASSGGGGVSYKELKRNLKNNAMKASQSEGGPQIKIDPPESPSETPKASALKFAEGEKPSRRAKMSKLQKFLSHEDSPNRKLDLEPSKSQPDLTQSFQPEEKKKKKKKKFWKLFK